ncbi:hypothetical protein LA080_000764 [Diaporthe eres]|nr:hypothetical protein LA080_000764 [Diaporthe eres]
MSRPQMSKPWNRFVRSPSIGSSMSKDPFLAVQLILSGRSDLLPVQIFVWIELLSRLYQVPPTPIRNDP